MNDKGVQVAIGSKRRETSAGGETETTSQIKTGSRDAMWNGLKLQLWTQPRTPKMVL